MWRRIAEVNCADAAWRSKVRQLALRYVALFSVMFAAAMVRDRVEAIGSALPLAFDVCLVLAYTLVTVLWVESVQDRGPRRRRAHHAIP